MALGATPHRVYRMVIGEHMKPVALGLAGGAVASWWTTTLLASLMYGIGPHEPALWALASAFVLGTALVATWVPARRASRTDPYVALKVE